MEMPLPYAGVRRIRSASSLSSQPGLAGRLEHKDATGSIIGGQNIYTNQDFLIGRDRARCQYVIDDPCISKKHLRIYTVVYDHDSPHEVDTLVYAEDLSRNGTSWNGSLIGRGNGGFLLSHDDILRLSSRNFLVFRSAAGWENDAHFDLIQEQEMQHFCKEYILTDRLLGAGAFGKVFMAVEQVFRTQLACKVVDLRRLRPRHEARVEYPAPPDAARGADGRVQMRKVKGEADQGKRSDKFEEKIKVYYREAEILASISHPNIVGLEKVYVTDNTVYMFQDLVTAGDLFSYIESKNGKLPEVEAAVITRQITIALCFLHERNIVHRDLKPDNILMTSLSAGCRVVLTDFGAARRIPHERHRMSTVVGTDEYAAPEVLGQRTVCKGPRQPGYTRSVDMWSLGCIAVVLLTGSSAFTDPTTQAHSHTLAEACDLDCLRRSREWQHVRTRPRDFVENLLVLDEEGRMTAKEALEHSWFSNDAHKTKFEDLYERTVKHWRPRTVKPPMVEFLPSGGALELGQRPLAQGEAQEIGTDIWDRIQPPFHDGRGVVVPI